VCKLTALRRVALPRWLGYQAISQNEANDHVGLWSDSGGHERRHSGIRKDEANFAGEYRSVLA